MARTLAELADAGLMDAGWARALEPVAPDIAALGERLRAEVAAGRRYLPAGDHVLRAFQRPLAEVKVLIVGQDPYPTPGHPIGLSFAVEQHVRPLPRSLSNIYRELSDDLGVAPAPHGDLSAWSDQGVMLLNRVLTVAPGRPGIPPRVGLGEGHRARDPRARRARRRARRDPVGEGCREPAAAARIRRRSSSRAHPSPLSASRGFFGSRPFSRANELLAQQGAAPVDWRIPAEA